MYALHKGCYGSYTLCQGGYTSQPKQYMMSVFCDISRAFDVIDHKIMLAKLEYYGFRGIVKKLLSDYLSKRIQFVEFENYKLNNVILSGVLKG